MSQRESVVADDRVRQLRSIAPLGRVASRMSERRLLVGILAVALLIRVVGIGYGLPLPETIPYIPEGEICFWGGYGGSMIVMDRARHLTIAYMMNKMEGGIIGGVRSAALLEAAFRALP